jgi:cell division septation protein DedD
MDPDTRRLVMFAGGLGTVLVVLIGASTFVGHHNGEIPVVSADTTPIRVKPASPGGMKIDGAENDVFSGGTDTADSRLAAPPENPDAKALHAAAAPPDAAAPAAAMQAPTPAAAKPQSTASVPVDRLAAGSTPIGSTPAARPAVTAAAQPAPADSARPHVAAPESHPPVSGRRAMVQLAALPTEDAAHVEWQHLARRMPDLLNGHQPSFSRAERGGHTFWRVRTSGFADTAQARAFCDHVRAKGGGCSVADF